MAMIKRMIVALAVMIFHNGAGLSVLAQETKQYPLTWHSAADKNMIDAIVKARETISYFWTQMESGKHNKTDFLIKVGLDTSSGNVEHIWVYELSRENGVFKGLLANDPYDVPNMKIDSPIKFTLSNVTDWAFEENGKLYGHYTTRVLLDDMSMEDATRMRAALGENP